MGEGAHTPKQRAIIRADGARHIVGQQAVDGVAAHAGREAEDLVGDGADLDADAALLHLVHDVGVARQGEAVADALRAEQQRVEEVAVRVGADVERLAAVEEERDLDVGRLAEGLELQELAGEGFERLAFAFLADEIEAWKPVVVVSSGLSVLQGTWVVSYRQCTRKTSCLS